MRDEARVALVGTVQTRSVHSTSVSTHLSFLPGWNVVQLRRLMTALAGDGGPLVVAGDFNLEERTVVRTTGLRPLGSALTFPADRPERQIDHVLGRRIEAECKGEAVHLPMSDHRALVVEIRG